MAMEWKEIVYICSSNANCQRLEKALPEQCQAIEKAEGLQAIEVFKVDRCRYDLAVMLSWDMPIVDEPRQSREALLLAEFMEQFGLIDHRILVQTYPQQQALAG
jgi:hypothetical protein